VNRARGSVLTRWLVLASASAAAVAISSAIGILPTYRMAGLQAAIALGVAAAVIWAASAVAAAPVAMWPASNPRATAQAIQVGMLLRFALTLAAALALVLGTGLPRTALLLWLGIHYLVALAVTTGVEVWLFRGRGPESS